MSKAHRQWRHIKNDGGKDVDEPTPKCSRSSLKMKFLPKVENNGNDNESNVSKNEHSAIIYVGILNENLKKFGLCKACKEGSLILKQEKRFGIVCKLSVTCSNLECRPGSQSFFSSRRSNLECVKRSQGAKPFALNVRAVLGMRMIGKGMKAMNLFMAVLNMSAGITQESYENILSLMDEKTEELSATSMNNAALEI